MFSHNFLYAILLLSFNVHAQLDPSSALLLRSGAKGTKEPVQLDSGRYTIRPVEVRDTTRTREVPPKVKETQVVVPPKPTPPPTPATSVVVTPPSPTATPAPVGPAQVVTPEEPEHKPAGVVDQVKELVFGADQEQIDAYREKLHDEDWRNNLVELNVAPTYVYNDSSSNYWFRNYTTSSPGFLIDAKLWATPFFAFAASIETTTGASISGSATTTDKIQVDHQWSTVGIRMRKFFGISRKASSINFGIDYSEYNLKPGSTAGQRMGLKTVGAEFSIEATMPRGNNFAWQLGALLIPRADHREVTAQVDVKSGTKENSTVVGLWLGGLHTFDRHNQVFWKFEQRIEKDYFSSTASTADPVTGLTPTGVSVTNSMSSFQLGYRWGN